MQVMRACLVGTDTPVAAKFEDLPVAESSASFQEEMDMVRLLNTDTSALQCFCSHTFEIRLPECGTIVKVAMSAFELAEGVLLLRFCV